MTTRLLRLAALTLVLAAAGRVAAAIPPAENLLPSDTLAFLAVPDCASARVAATSSPGWMFWSDPAMRPFHDKFMGKWNEQFIAPLERDLGIKVADFMDLPQGQFTLAMTINGSNGHDNVPPGLLLLLDAKGKSGLLKTNLAALIKKWNDAGRALRTENIHGLAFTVVPLSSNDFAGILPKKTPVSEIGQPPAKPEKPGEIYFAQFETLLLAGNSAKVVEPVVAHLTGGSVPAIADNANFAADKLSQFRDHPQYFAWFNGKAFIDLVSQTPAGSEEETATPLGGFSPAKTLAALGFNGLKSVSVALHETREGSSMTIHVTAPEATRTGLLKILGLPPRDASVPPFVPADAVKFTRVRLDGKQTWAELQKMISALTPNGQAGLNAVINIANSLGQQKNPGFDIRNDLFGNLNDDVITYQKAAASGTELDPPAPLYLVAVANPDAMIAAITTIAAMSNPQADATPAREFLGHKIRTIALSPVRTAAGMQTRAVHAASSGGYVALSLDESMVEEFLRSAGGQGKSLRDNAGLQAALLHLGGAGGGLFGYENQRETMRATFKALHNTAAADNALKVFPPAVREWLDFSLLPAYDTVSKYFYVSTFAGSANSEGLTFTAFAPRPPALN
jgi:hypothetical protein